MNIRIKVFFGITLFICACKNNTKSSELENNIIDSLDIEVTQEKLSDVQPEKTFFMPFTVNDTLALKIAEVLKNNFFKDDYAFLSEDNKKFQMAEVDLDADGKNEVFINFFSSYFCGTGGCTLVLFNNDLKQITRFTVTRTPLFIQNEIKNGWKTILVKSDGKFVKLIFDGKSYPSNPSVVETVDYLPSGSDMVLFDDQFSPSKTYTY